MLVAMVTAPDRPACATISASFSWNLAFSTLCLMPRRFSMSPSISLTATLMVPTRTGRPFSCSSATSSMTAFHFPLWLRKTRSAKSSRIMSRLVGTTTTSRL